MPRIGFVHEAGIGEGHDPVENPHFFEGQVFSNPTSDFDLKSFTETLLQEIQRRVHSQTCEVIPMDH